MRLLYAHFPFIFVIHGRSMAVKKNVNQLSRRMVSVAEIALLLYARLSSLTERGREGYNLGKGGQPGKANVRKGLRGFAY